MLTQVTEYCTPANLPEAMALLNRLAGEAALVGGGLDLTWRPRSGVKVLVGLDRLPLAFIERRGDGLALGATTTIRQWMESPLLAETWNGLFPKILRRVATPLLRSLITIGGALIRAYPWADLPMLFLGLEAQVVLFNGEDHVLSLAEFYRQHHDLIVSPFILREVILPWRPEWSMAYRRFTRTAVDIPLLNQLLCLRQNPSGEIAEVSIWLGSRPGPALRVEEAERCLVGNRLQPEIVEQAVSAMQRFAPVESDMRLSGEMRRHLAGVLLRSNLEEVAGHAD